MKKLIAIALLLCLVLGGCAEKEMIEPGTEPATTQPSQTEPSAVEETEPVIEETEPAAVYRNPLTGEILDQPYTGRIVSVSIGNTKAALPHLGISHADVMYEVETEGGITRFMPIFSNYDFADKIGPVRSARTYYNNISESYRACLVHCGGSKRGIIGYYDLTGVQIPNWVHLDQQKNGSYFFRDTARKSAGYALEHTLFTTGEKLMKAMQDKGYINGTVVNYGYQFAEDENLTISGQTAEEVVVSFLGKKTTTFIYDAQKGAYNMNQYGGAVIDGNNNEHISFKNLIVIYTEQSKQHDGYYNRSYYELNSSGEGYFAVNGQIVPIKWSRSLNLNKPFVFTLEDGTPITLGVGTTYVGVSSTNSSPIAFK